jgi:hypothetical protein
MQPLLVLMIILGVIGVIVLITLTAVGAARRERERKASLLQFAAASGFTFYDKDPFNLDARFRGVGEIGRGHNRYAFEVLQRSEPAGTFIFRYHFQTTETRTVTSTDSNGHTTTRTETYEQDHWRAYLIVELGTSFPDLIIRREHWGDKVAGFMGFDDIDFESEAFSSRYFVKSSDRQFAYAVVHPQMMEWMLQTPIAARLSGALFVIDMTSMRFDAASCGQCLAAAAGFINRIPAFVWQDYGKRPPLTLPSLPALGDSTGLQRSSA